VRCRKCSTTPPLALNLLGGRFDADYPDQVWVADITYLKAREGWLYLAVVIDLYCRMVVGWSINNRMTRDLVINGLAKAIKRRNHDPGLICHSDRGSRYCSHAYQDLLKNHGFLYSMSRKGKCLDNAVAESFFHSLKVKWISGEPPVSRNEMCRSVREYIEVFYKRQRLHSANGYLSPCDFERVDESTLLMSA
jgi:putative transposase